MARVASLDSLRGIAALTVLFDHYALILPGRPVPPQPPWRGGSWTDAWWWIDDTPLKLLFDGDQAVLVFFALSGFVLALSFQGAPGQSYLHYIIKRFIRLYVPFAAAVLLAAGLFLLARPTAIPQLSFYFNNFCWNQPLTAGVLLGHLAMTDRDAFQRLDHVMWSLVQETRISFLFPFIFIWAKARWLATTALSVVVSGSALTAFHFLRWDPLFDPLFTLSYLFLFAVGAVVALRATRLAGLFNGLPRVARLGLWLLTLGIVTYYPANRHYGLFVCGTAALMLVFLCHADLRARRWLSVPFAVWLGRISFSLYLVHMPILLFVVHMLHGILPLPVLLGLSAVITFGMAELGFRFVERPAIRAGRALADRVAPGGAGVRSRPAAPRSRDPIDAQPGAIPDAH